ncbi:hypothetical protein ACFQRK_04075 [Parapedobacter sp. GCM10030251]|uniref:hypothetical protein n=1 Tax=Parapedobacter sp. GCM10030251 TaxID=3273419 RepID=UPI003623774F
MENKTIQNRYYFQALDNYPYNLEEAVTALNYALAYDANDADSLCLMGRLHHEVLRDYRAARRYFEEALAADVYTLSVYPYFADCLLALEEMEHAKKLIDFALTLKGMDKGVMLQKKATYYERLRKWNKALDNIRQAAHYASCTQEMDALDEREKLIERKKKKTK